MHLFMQSSQIEVSAIIALKITQAVIPEENKPTNRQTKQTKRRNTHASVYLRTLI